MGRSPEAPWAGLNGHALAGAVEQVLMDWAYLNAQPGGRPAPGPADLPLEVAMRLSGPRRYLLVLRAAEALGGALAVASTGDPGAAALGPAAFHELGSLAARALIRAVPEDDAGGYRTGPPLPCRPSEWPTEEPLGQSVLFVENLPLELRLWRLDGSAPMRLAIGENLV